MIADSDCARGHFDEPCGDEPSAPILSEQQFMQQRLDLAGRGVRLRAGAPSGMLKDQWSARRGDERLTMDLPGEHRPAA